MDNQQNQTNINWYSTNYLNTSRYVFLILQRLKKVNLHQMIL